MNYVWFLILMQTQCISCCRALPFRRSYRFSRFLQDVNCTEDSIKHQICQHANGACKSSLDSKRIKGHNVLTKLSSYQEHQSLDQPAPPRPWSRCPPCQSQLQWSWSPLYTDPLWKEKQVYINHRARQWRNCLNCRNESWEEDRCMFQIIHLCEQSCLRTTHLCHEFMCHKSASITWPNNRATPPDPFKWLEHVTSPCQAWTEEGTAYQQTSQAIFSPSPPSLHSLVMFDAPAAIRIYCPKTRLADRWRRGL